MGFYGNKFLNTGYSEININEFFDIINEQQLLFEDTFALAVTNQNDKVTIEETKKKLLDIIKEVFNKVISVIRNIIDRFIEFIKSIEDKINRDEIVKKFARGITWKDVETALNNGWKGIPESRYYADMDQDQLVKNQDILRDISISISADYDFDFKKLAQDIEKIKDMKSIEEARKAYNDHVKYINSHMEEVSSTINYDVNRNNYFTLNVVDGRYKPNLKLFQMLENSSINSRSIIKNLKDQGKKLTDKIKRENIDPLKKEIEYNLNATADNAEFLKIENYYIKTKLAYNNFILQNTIKGINKVVKQTKENISINTELYLYIARSIRPYLKSKESKGEN